MVRFPFRHLVPTFFAGLIDDPLLLLRTRADGRHLMFDCGQVHHLAKRTFTNLEAIFISHAHMDHWMGIDSVVRQLIAAGKTVDIFGAPGIIDKFEHKLRGYDWNLAEDYWSCFRVHDVDSDRIRSALFDGADSFIRNPLGEQSRDGLTIFQNDFVEVLSDSCDHRIASLIFRINERPSFSIDRQKLAEMKLVPGRWLADLKRCYLHQQDIPEELTLIRKDSGEEREVRVRDVKQLVADLIRPKRQQAIGYISDIGYTTSNRQRIVSLLKGVDLLCCECTFLKEAKDRARTSWHLCTDDVNELLSELKPKFFLPMHLSRSYSRRSADLYRELEPPPETQVLELPLQRTPRPLIADEVHWKAYI